MGKIREDKERREIAQIAVDISRVMDEKTLLTMCQGYMMSNMIQKINLELIPPAYGSKNPQCLIKYEIIPFELPSPENPYEGETSDDYE